MRFTRRMLTLLSSVLAVAASGTASVTYWNAFNIEGESSELAAFVTYATLTDMPGDTNRLGTFLPDILTAGANTVGSGCWRCVREWSSRTRHATPSRPRPCRSSRFAKGQAVALGA
jgi:hypothetical protein